MQSRVADLIERCQDEIILESTLQINDELNSVFVRYERLALLTANPPLTDVGLSFATRYLRNREALQQPAEKGTTGEEGPPAMEGGVATTSLSEVCRGCGGVQGMQKVVFFGTQFQPASGISYPSLDEQPPPAYEGGTTVGTLIDLGTDISAPAEPAPRGQDIVSQLADMGITGGQAPSSESTLRDVEQSHDEFDMFAKSRTAYAGNTG